MKDDEDDIIDLIFYCVGCNIVDILGMVGELNPLPHIMMKQCQRQFVLHIALSCIHICIQVLILQLYLMKETLRCS